MENVHPTSTRVNCFRWLSLAGIYQYGKFGMRLEDIMAITETGAEMMTPTQMSLSPAL